MPLDLRRRIVRHHQRVACFAEALPGEIERRDDRRAVVGDEILGVVLHHRIGVGMQRRAGVLQRAPQLRHFFLGALGARGDEHFDGDAAVHRGLELVEHRRVVAPEQRQRDAPPRLADDVEERGAPLIDRDDQPIGRNPWAGRHANIDGHA